MILDPKDTSRRTNDSHFYPVTTQINKISRRLHCLYFNFLGGLTYHLKCKSELCFQRNFTLRMIENVKSVEMPMAKGGKRSSPMYNCPMNMATPKRALMDRNMRTTTRKQSSWESQCEVFVATGVDSSRWRERGAETQSNGRCFLRCRCCFPRWTATIAAAVRVRTLTSIPLTDDYRFVESRNCDEELVMMFLRWIDSIQFWIQSQ